MSKWGVFPNDEEKVRHIMPSDAAGNALEPHESTLNCKCNYKLAYDGFVIHHDPERGGFNT